MVQRCRFILIGVCVLTSLASADEAQRALGRAVGYLEKQVDNTGRLSSQDYRFRNDGSKALTAWAMARSGKRPATSTSLAALIAQLKKHDSPNPQTRAAAVQLWVELKQPRDIKLDVNWLLEHQGADGGWNSGQKGASNLIDTAFVLMALRSAAQAGEGIPLSTWAKCIKFIDSCKNQAWSGYGYQPAGTKPLRLQGSSNGLATAAAMAGAGAAQDATADPAARRAFVESVLWQAKHLKLNRVTPWEWSDPPLMTYLFLITRGVGSISPMQIGQRDLTAELTQTLLARQNSDGSFRPSGLSEDRIVATALGALMLDELSCPVTLVATGLPAGNAEALANSLDKNHRGTWRTSHISNRPASLRGVKLLCIAKSLSQKSLNSLLAQAVKHKTPILVKLSARKARPITDYFTKLSAKPATLPASHPLQQAIGKRVTGLKAIRHQGRYAVIFLDGKSVDSAIMAKVAGFLNSTSQQAAVTEEFATTGHADIGWIIHKGDWKMYSQLGDLLSPDLAAAINRSVKVRAISPDRAISPAPALLWMTGLDAHQLTDASRENIKSYIYNGGMLVLDSILGDSSEQQAGLKLLTELTGERPQTLSVRSPLLSGKFGGGVGNNITQLSLKGSTSKGSPSLWAVVSKGRVIALMSRYPLGLSICNPKNQTPTYTSLHGRKIVLNLLLYAHAAKAGWE